jgi:hypothetical protein
MRRISEILKTPIKIISKYKNEKDFIEYEKKKKKKKKIKKKKKNSCYVLGVVYKLIDLCEECYYYQNEKKQELVELNDWKELMDKFIHEKTIVVDREKDNEDDKKDDDISNNEFSIDIPLNEKDIELKNQFGNFEYEELLNYINFCGDFSIKNPVKIKMDIFDIMGEDIMILVNDYGIDEDDDSYRGKNLSNRNNKEKINYKELYEPRNEDLEQLNIVRDNPKDFILGNIINEIINVYSKNKNYQIDFDEKKEDDEEEEDEEEEKKEEEDSQNPGSRRIVFRLSGLAMLGVLINFLEHIENQSNQVDEKLLKRIPIIEVEDKNKLSDDNKKCTICQDEYNNKDKVIVLPCLHVFHPDCINNWFSSKNTCPNCKFLLTKSNLYNQEGYEETPEESLRNMSQIKK